MKKLNITHKQVKELLTYLEEREDTFLVSTDNGPIDTQIHTGAFNISLLLVEKEYIADRLLEEELINQHD